MFRECNDVQQVIDQFATKNITALHGGRKGNGFWLYDVDNKVIVAPNKKSGNKKFWKWDDAIAYLAQVG